MKNEASAPPQGANRYNTPPDYTTSADAVRQFSDAVYRDAGAIIQPIPDSLLHRFDDPKGRRGNLACWYILHADNFPAGVYGNWRTGDKKNWQASAVRQLHPNERVRANTDMRAAKLKRDADKAQGHAQAAERARRLWASAAPASSMHAYLRAKHIPPLSLRQMNNQLLVPLRDVHGALLNLQTINPSGEKRFLKGGRITACFSLIGATELPSDGELYICEGWATGATIASTLHLPVAAALTAGNLKSVALSMRGKYPRLAIVVAADNDHRTPGNPGMAAGREAARAALGALTWPSVCLKHGCTCTDFNDTARCQRLQK